MENLFLFLYVADVEWRLCAFVYLFRFLLLSLRYSAWTNNRTKKTTASNLTVRGKTVPRMEHCVSGIDLRNY